MVRYHFVGVGALTADGRGGGGEPMEWTRILTYITRTIDHELLLRNQIPGCRKSDLEGSVAEASEALRC